MKKIMLGMAIKDGERFSFKKAVIVSVSPILTFVSRPFLKAFEIFKPIVYWLVVSITTVSLIIGTLWGLFYLLTRLLFL